MVEKRKQISDIRSLSAGVRSIAHMLVRFEVAQPASAAPQSIFEAVYRAASVEYRMAHVYFPLR
jgi:hypothetical protein